MIDIDNFKQINDKFGHLGGDSVLHEISQLLRRRLRSIDYAGRYGGEELTLLLIGTGIDEAKLIAEELRATIAAGAYAGGRVHATASFGIAAFGPADSWNMEELIAAADTALYQAKHCGRNRVEVFIQSSSTK